MNQWSDLETRLGLYKTLELIKVEAVRMVEKLVLSLQAKYTDGSNVDPWLNQQIE